ncbi:hypothetical protein A9P82_03975 [Arachidicoccus ginsenosidimutans]|uniref:outer membrane beta-barrel family protein n=1 Tax=Arachidicoccus sp. BS20 TaxID=1850526 RepID=UPI0007F12C53|nr:outer membrane beta-barrel family protein [Arachidicoccus sp. BS20]ANI88529.1 hypothetical protein A9P82_03975 [Arachidicoccus sp. BS20]
MKKFILLDCILFLCLYYANAQSSIHGKVIDTTSGQNLTNAAACLIEAKDSMLYKFTRIKQDGSFNINNVDTGKYILLVSYPEFADFVSTITVADSSKNVDLGTINMIQMEHLLKDVIVKQQLGAIRIKGDTTEFVADSFKTQPNATVEDLLKKLPGIQVDKDGKITAQGQTVPKVLVDGEEFFGDDPTLVTKNLRADMVDRVQVYDKQSDQSAFTGIDDGNKTKTINIKLKEDKKNGYFGKVSGGLGTDNYKETQDMFNYFKGKRKIAAYLTMANTGKTGLGFEDEMKYGSSGDNMQVLDGGGIVVFGGGNNNDPLSSVEGWDGNYDGNGIPNAKTGGVHFDNKWNDDKQGINLNYKIGSISEKGNGQTLSQENLPTGVLFDSSANNFYKEVFRQKLDAIYNLQFDSSSSLKLTAGGSLAHLKSDTYSANQTTRADGSLVNDGWNNTTGSGNAQAFNGSLLWRKKFKKKGRTISLNFNEYLKNSDNSGFMNSYNYFYDNDSTSSVDQRKTNKNKTNSTTGKLAYTEPLTKWLSLVANYSIDIENTNSDLRSYNRNTDSAYSLLDSTYSNHYIYNQLTNSGGVAFAYNRGKLNFNVGTNVGSSQYHQTNTFTDEKLNRSFINWAPNAYLRYKVATQSNLSFNYRGSTRQPSAEQIQPVLNNADVLNIYIGNPYLKPSFSNSLSLNYNMFKVISQQNIWGYISYNFTTNPIVENVTTDTATGKSVHNYFNINTPTRNYYSYVDYGRKIKKWDINYDVSVRYNGYKSINYINDASNTITSNSYSLGLRLGKYKENKLDVSLSGNAKYTTNNATLQNQINNNYWTLEFSPNIDVFLPAKFQIHTEGTYTWNQKTETLPAYSQFIWNAWIGKKFFKKENLLINISANDILNQNNSYTRDQYTQSFHTTIKRYFMLSVVWNFSKMGGVATTK